MTQTEAISPSPFQRRVLEYSEEINIALLGGKGGGKSMLMAMLALRYGEQYQERARMLFVRKTYAGLRDFEETTKDLYAAAYGDDARYSGNNHIWRLPGRAYFELAQLENHADLAKFAGRSFGLIFVDELGQYAGPDIIANLTANLRAKKGVPTRKVYAANPGSVGQSWIYRKFIAGRTPWVPFRDDEGEWWVYCPSTLTDNPHLDREKYRRTLESALRDDPEALKALLEGSFTSQTGAYFGTCLDERRNAVGPFTIGKLPSSREIPKGKMFAENVPWRTHLAIDFGSSAPSVAYLMAESPGAEYEGKFYPRGSILILDEYAVYRRDSLNQGLGWTAAITAEAIADFCKEWGVKPTGVGDDAMFARTGHASSIADEFRAKGVCLLPAKKGDRISGWQRMRRMLADAGKPDVPGLYISRSAKYFWDTIPFLPRCPKRPEDLDSTSPDHGADACRYGLLYQRMTASVHPLRV